MKAHIAVLAGDGIGPEVTSQAVAILRAAAELFGHEFRFAEYPIGGGAWELSGSPLPEATLAGALAADAVLLGAVGGPAWDALPPSSRPEKGLLSLRKALGVYANLRPAALMPALASACPIKDSVLAASSPDGEPSFDLLIVRELTGGLYFGERGRAPDGSSAFDTETYSAGEIDRLLRAAFEAAVKRRGKLCVVDKANVLETSRLWRERAKAMEADYPGVELSFMYVDNCAMQLVRAPGAFDVIATSNLFGDILSDEASVLTGSIGMLPSASLGEAPAPGRGPRGLYEPIHGSAPDIAGKDIANPLGAILSAAMLLRHSFGLEAEARAIELAVSEALGAGYRTADLADAHSGNAIPVGTLGMGRAVLAMLNPRPGQV